MAELHDVLTEDPLHIKYLPGTSTTLVVSFAGVGTQHSVSPPPEFFKIASAEGANHVLFISDISRSWLNGDGMVERIKRTIELIAEMANADRVLAIGNSMGATMAILMSDYVKFDTVTALVPQVSVHPDIVPEETRWMRFRKRIKTYRFEQITKLNARDTQYFVFHGGTDDELVHAARFPAFENGEHFILPDEDHNLAKSLRKSDQLSPLMYQAMMGHKKRVHRRVMGLGGQVIAAYAANSKQSAKNLEFTRDRETLVIYR